MKYYKSKARQNLTSLVKIIKIDRLNISITKKQHHYEQKVPSIILMINPGVVKTTTII